MDPTDNSHLVDRLPAKVGDLVQLIIPGALLRGNVASFDDCGSTVILTTTDEPPVRWAINARQIIAVGRIGRAQA